VLSKISNLFFSVTPMLKRHMNLRPILRLSHRNAYEHRAARIRPPMHSDTAHFFPDQRGGRGLGARRAGGVQTALPPADRRGCRLLCSAEAVAAKSGCVGGVGGSPGSWRKPLDDACVPGGGHDQSRAHEGAQLAWEARQPPTRAAGQCR
jgi:hypothetical protein